MSRVNDAMRRAGHRGDEPDPSTDDAFLPGEDGVEDAYEEIPHVEDDVHAAPPPAPATRAELVPHEMALPVAVPTHSLERSLERPRSESGDDIKLHEVFRLILRRKWMIAGVVALSFGAVLVYNQTVIPVYQATATVRVEPTAQQTLPFRGSGEDPGRYDYLVTQLEVLKSRALATKTVERIAQMPADKGLPREEAQRIVGSVNAAPRKTVSGDSRVVNISVRAKNPTYAALVANAHAQTYVDQNLENLREGSREASEWLSARIAELKREVNATQETLQAYRENKDAVSLEDRSNIVVAKLTQVSAATVEAEVDLRAKKPIYDQLLELEKRNAPLDTLTPIQTNASLQAKKADLEKLRQERAKMSADLLPTHPEMLKIDETIRSQNQLVNTETQKIVDSIKSEYFAAQTKRDLLQTDVQKQNAEVLELSRKGIGYSALERDATTVKQIFDTVMTRLRETELSGELPSNNIHILDLAEVPGEPVSPRPLLNIALALLAGTVVAIGLALGLEFLRPRLLDPQDIASSLGLPLLGTTPRVAKFRRGPADLANVPGSFQEAIRHIRAQIFLSSASSGLRTLAVTSARPGEGKTVVSSSLAISIAMSGRRVLLIDGDMRRANLGTVFDIPKSPGLSNVISASIKPSAALVETPIKGLYVLPAGDAHSSNPADLLDSRRLHQLIAGLKKVFDVVVIDCPPVMAVADAAIVASAATSVVFVVSAGHTNTELARLAIERLEGVQARILGVVLNNAKAAPSDSYHPYYAPTKPVEHA